MNNHQNIYKLILELDQLKSVFRTTITSEDRQESTAEHSWSVGMIIMVLMEELKNEFDKIDEFKAVKLGLIHDIVEVYAGDVLAFDIEARKQKEKIEAEALEKLKAIYPEFGEQLHDLWYEFENRESIEAKIAKAADSICPVFMRLQAKQSYDHLKITIAHLDKTKRHLFEFSKTFMALFEKLKIDLLKEKLILP